MANNNLSLPSSASTCPLGSEHPLKGLLTYSSALAIQFRDNGACSPERTKGSGK